jgi:large subunit ribosomal protein L28
MAKVCYSCGKRPSFGNARSHSLRATRRRWNPNLQKIRIQEGASTKRAYVCTSCLKSFKVQKAAPRVRPAPAEGTPV